MDENEVTLYVAPDKGGAFHTGDELRDDGLRRIGVVNRAVPTENGVDIVIALDEWAMVRLLAGEPLTGCFENGARLDMSRT